MTAQRAGDSEDALRESASGVAGRAEASLAPEDGGADLPLGEIVGGLDARAPREGPQRDEALQQVVAEGGGLPVRVGAAPPQRMEEFPARRRQAPGGEPPGRSERSRASA